MHGTLRTRGFPVPLNITSVNPSLEAHEACLVEYVSSVEKDQGPKEPVERHKSHKSIDDRYE